MSKFSQDDADDETDDDNNAITIPRCSSKSIAKSKIICAMSILIVFEYFQYFDYFPGVNTVDQ